MKMQNINILKLKLDLKISTELEQLLFSGFGSPVILKFRYLRLLGQQPTMLKDFALREILCLLGSKSVKCMQIRTELICNATFPPRHLDGMREHLSSLYALQLCTECQLTAV